MWILVLFMLSVTSSVFANDVVYCDPNHPQVVNGVSRPLDIKTSIPETPGILVWIAANNSMTQAKQDYMNTLRSQIDSLNGVVPLRHWICYDSADADSIVDSVREMTQVEKGLVEANRLAIQARSQQIDDERATNDVCNAEPAALDTRIDDAYLNKNTAAEIKATTVAIIKKLARCVWARTTVN
jgi:hypothetical protein